MVPRPAACAATVLRLPLETTTTASTQAMSGKPAVRRIEPLFTRVPLASMSLMLTTVQSGYQNGIVTFLMAVVGRGTWDAVRLTAELEFIRKMTEAAPKTPGIDKSFHGVRFYENPESL